MVRFTGTFLKMVRYAGSDGPRLAPLIVGGQQPAPYALKTAASDSARKSAPSERVATDIQPRRCGQHIGRLGWRYWPWAP